MDAAPTALPHLEPSCVPPEGAFDAARVEEAIDFCTGVIGEGSKSFSLASKLFAADSRRGAVMVYGWCRHADDRIDDAQSETEVHLRLQELQAQTRNLYLGRTSEYCSQAERYTFAAFGAVLTGRKIPAHYPLELLEGMAMDARGERYPDFNRLRLYCFRVAGTVGLMMSHVMGVKDERALDQAVDLGLAMQLTNIARDVREDFERGRVYLPENWLREWGAEPNQLLAPQSREAVYGVVQRLLAEAERLYQSGQQGISALPFRAALAVQAAALIYREIGREILRRGPAALDSRTVIPGVRKLQLAAQGVFQVLLSLPSRWFDSRALRIPVSLWRFKG